MSGRVRRVAPRDREEAEEAAERLMMLGILAEV